MLDIQVRFIGKPWPNHSDHSGYHQLVPRVGSEVPVPDISSFRNTLMPGKVAVKLAKRSGVVHYGYDAFYHEWAAAREMPGLGKPTVYHILYGDQSFRYLGRMRFSRKARIVATFHIPPRRLEKELKTVGHLRTLDAVIVVGSNQAPFFSRVVDPARVYVVPHGVDTETFRPAGEGAGTSRKGKRCLFVGMHERDFETLAEVIDIVGSEDKLVAFDVVTSAAMQEGFADRENVTFYSNVSEERLIELYQQSDVLLQPLLEATANNAILEGLACGVPIVASDLGATRDYLTEECAVLVPGGEACPMAEAVISLLKDEQRLEAMAVKARQQAMHFEWAQIAKRFEGIYEGLF